MSDRLSAYIKKRLLPQLGCAAGPFTLERCHAGMHSEVYFLTIPSREPLVLKIFSKRPRFRSTVAGLHHLAERGIPVPKIIALDEDNRLFNRRGMHVLCQERIMGDSLEHTARSPELLTRVAQLYAGMHATVRSSWGDIGRGSTARVYPYLQKKMLQRLDGWSRAEKLAPALRQKITASFAAGESAVDRISSFSLSHTDPNRNNLIVRASDGQLFLLDTGSLRYLPRAIDYFMLQAYLCFNNQDHGALFEKAYFETMPRQEIAKFQVTQQFFQLYVAVLFLHDLTTRFAALDRKSPYFDEFAGLIPLAKNALLELLEKTHHAEA